MIDHMVAVVFTTDVLNYIANETGGEHEFLMLIAVAAVLTWSCAGILLRNPATVPPMRRKKPPADSDAPAAGRHRAH